MSDYGDDYRSLVTLGLWINYSLIKYNGPFLLSVFEFSSLVFFKEGKKDMIVLVSLYLSLLQLRQIGTWIRKESISVSVYVVRVRSE